MFRWRLGLYGALVIFIALGVYLRIGKDLPAEEARVGRPGQPSATSGLTDSPSSGEPALLRSQAAKRVHGDLDSSRRLILVALDGTTGSPIAEAEIRLYEIDSRNGNETEYGSAYANARGEAGFDPPQGSYAVAAHHQRYASLRESVDVGATGPVRKNLLMTPAIGVAGVVTDPRGRPKPRAAIAFSASDGTTVEVSGGADGSFQTWLPSGRFDVVARDAADETVMHGVEIWPGKEFFLEIRLGQISPSVPFSGKVESARGPVSDAVVQVRPARRPDRRSNPSTYRIVFYHSVKVDGDGRFSLNLPPMGEALLTIAAAGHETLRQRVNLNGSAPQTFRLQQERGFHLKVIDERGIVVPGVEIVGVNQDGRRVVQDKGRFVYSSSEYPFEIYAVDRRSGQPMTEKKRIDVYQPEILLESSSR